jgi:hypothetical protein
MNECKKCGSELDNTRAHLGYTDCLDCSEVEAYSAHTVYPHKTGGYVQPVSKTAANNLKRIDRRSTGKTRSAKGIYADQSWDRWLDRYYENLYNPKPKPKVVKDVCTIKHMNYDTLYNKTMLHYKDNGYQHTVTWLKELFNTDKISLGNKSKMLEEINHFELLPKRLRKWTMKIK